MLLSGLCGVVPLLFCFSFYDAFDLPKLSLVYTVDIVLLTLWLKDAAVQGDIVFWRSELDLPLALFLLATALSAFHSKDSALSFFGAYRIYVFGTLPIMGFAVLYWLCRQVSEERLLTRVVSIAMAASSMAGLYGLLQYKGDEIFDQMPLVAGGRVWSSLGNPIYLGALCMMGFPLTLVRLLEKPFLSSRLRLGGLLVAGALQIAGLALSLSRSAWLGCIGALFIVALAAAWRSNKGSELAKRGLVLAAILLSILALLAITSPGVQRRFSVLLSTSEGSNAARIEGWKGGFLAWRESPWFGSGPDTFFQTFRRFRSTAYVRATGWGVTQGDAHNDFLQVLSTQGLIGLALWSWIILVILSRSFRIIRSSSLEEVGVAAGVIALGIQNQFNFSSVSTSTWAAVGLGLLMRPPEIRHVQWQLPNWSQRLLRWAPLGGAIGIWFVSQPLRADAAYMQGMGFSASGSASRALSSFREATRLNGRLEVYVSALANAARSAALQTTDPVQRQALFQEAWRAADSMIRDHPQNPDAWNNRGVADMWLSQLAGMDLKEEAYRSFLQAAKMDPVFVDALANLAKCEHLRGHLEEEKVWWRRVLAIDPDYAMALEVLGKK